MALFTTTIPQNITPAPSITIEQVIAAIPETIPFTETIGLSGKIKGGKQVGTVVFQCMTDGEIPTEMQVYFNDLIEAATDGQFHAVVMKQWRSKDVDPMWILTDGRKIIGNDLKMLEAPPAKAFPVELNWSLIQPLFPATIAHTRTSVYLVGGLPKNGFSYNDVDFVAANAEEVNGEVVITEAATKEECKVIRTVLNAALSVDVFVKTDVGNIIMRDREPVYFYKIYENGQFVAGV